MAWCMRFRVNTLFCMSSQLSYLTPCPMPAYIVIVMLVQTPPLEDIIVMLLPTPLLKHLVSLVHVCPACVSNLLQLMSTVVYTVDALSSFVYAAACTQHSEPQTYTGSLMYKL